MLALLSDFRTQITIGLMLLVFIAVPFVLRSRRVVLAAGQASNDLPRELL